MHVETESDRVECCLRRRIPASDRDLGREVREVWILISGSSVEHSRYSAGGRARDQSSHSRNTADDLVLAISRDAEPRQHSRRAPAYARLFRPDLLALGRYRCAAPAGSEAILAFIPSLFSGTFDHRLDRPPHRSEYPRKAKDRIDHRLRR